MDDRTARLESAIEQLRSAVQSLQQRVDALEADRATVASQAQAASTGTPPAAVRRDPYDPVVILTLIGRLFLVLAGGFFLRAMTEAGVLAVPAGIASAFTYGLVWLFLADRAGRRQQVTSSIFHALGAALVVFPLSVEATTRFMVLGGAASAFVVAVLTVGFLFVAWRQRLQAIGWITVLAALPTGVILLIKTVTIAHFGLYVVALGIATLWAAYLLNWNWLRWPVALAADLVIVGVTMRALSPVHQDLVPVATLLQLSLLAAYLGSIAIRTLLQGRNVSSFDAVQTTAAVVLGFGGAVYLSRTAGALPAVLGLVSLALGAACYAVTFAVVGQRAEHGRNVYYYSSLALVFVVTGLALEAHGHWLAAVLAALGVVATGLWSRLGRLYLLLHGATYAVVAGVVSGAFDYAGAALASSPSGPWPLPGSIVTLVLAAGALSVWLAAQRPAPEGGFAAGTLRFAMILVFVWVAGGWLTGYIAPLVAGNADQSVDAGALATVRTAVLAIATLLTAWIARHTRFREWAWLVYPLLVGTGLKMVAQDFKDSRPATLFIALALYGAALILAPRLKRSAPTLRPGAGSS